MILIPELVVYIKNSRQNQKYFEYSNELYDVHRGDKYYFINNKTKNHKNIDRYIEEQIFIREFKAQLQSH